MVSELPLLLFTLFGSLAAGIYFATALFPKAIDGKRSTILAIVALALLAIGAVALLFHLQHPERLFLAFKNISAGITQEAYATIAFGIVVVVDLILSIVKKESNRAVHIAGAVLGLVLVFVMANAYFSITTNVALNSWLTFVVFIFAAIALGFTLGATVCQDEETGKAINLYAAIAGAVLGIFLLIQGIHFSGAEQGIAPFIVAAICAIAGGACSYLAKAKGGKFAVVAFVLVLVAVVVSRYAFYLAI